MARIKYIRVSTKEQNTARQEQDKALYDKIYLEKISGKDTNRPQLQAMLDYVREGDVVEVESYSRLARDTRDLLNIIDALNKRAWHSCLKRNKSTPLPPQGGLCCLCSPASPSLSANKSFPDRRRASPLPSRRAVWDGPKSSPATTSPRLWRRGSRAKQLR